MNASELAELSFFLGFDHVTLEKLAAIGERVEAEAGALIIDQGAVGTEAFVISSGRVRIMVNGEDVAEVGPGSILGEMALLELRPRSASAIAVVDTELVSFDKRRFTDVVAAMPAADRAALELADSRFRSENLKLGLEKSAQAEARRKK